jgi:hypothetical protein
VAGELAALELAALELAALELAAGEASTEPPRPLTFPWRRFLSGSLIVDALTADAFVPDDGPTRQDYEGRRKGSSQAGSFDVTSTCIALRTCLRRRHVLANRVSSARLGSGWRLLVES